MGKPTLIAVVGAALLQGACMDSRTPTDANKVSVSIASLDRSGGSDKTISILDACDPTTFGARGISCTRSGGVTFDQFNNELAHTQQVGGWRFAPSNVNVKVGQTFTALNRGGEMHTFTEVEEFGGGIIPGLNTASGNPVEAPECKLLTQSDFILPGQSRSDVADEEGSEKYQCCIHPWMRAIVTAKK